MCNYLHTKQRKADEELIMMYEVSRLENENTKLRKDLTEVNRENQSLITEIKELTSGRKLDVNNSDDDIKKILINVISRQKRELSVTKVLQLTEWMATGERLVILSDTWSSAAISDTKKFENCHTLAYLLAKLVGPYYNAFFLNQGDPSTVFSTEEFAETEKSGTMSRDDNKEKRTFDYEGKKITMKAHLKIRVEFDDRFTLRVYLHRDRERKKIVIGYCGPHM